MNAYQTRRPSIARGRGTLLLLLLLVVLAALAQRQPADRLLAHGGGIPRVINRPAGPYTLSIWTDPDPLVTNDTHVEIAVLNPTTLEPIVRGVRVMVELQTPERPGERFVKEATTAQSAIKTLYVAVYDDLPTGGRWDVTVLVEGDAGTANPVSFPIDIESPPPPNWLQYGLLAGAVVIAAAVVVLWSRRQPQRQTRPRHRPAPRA